MAAVVIRNQENPLGGHFDFSSPKTLFHGNSISQCLNPESREQLRTTLKIRNPVPSPTRLPEILTPLTPLDSSPPSIMSVANAKRKGPTLLTIPLEIRLQIYSYVLLSHPVHHAHLSPITTSSNASPYIKEEIHHTTFNPQPVLNYGPGISYPSHHTHSKITTFSLPANRALEPTIAKTCISHTPTHPNPQTKIPTALLLSCHQIYDESHLLPFQTSHFAFVNWFWSGVYAARQFSRGLKPWQHAAMQWVSVEVLGRDLWSGGMERVGGGIGGLAAAGLGEGGRKVGEWVELCGLWRGLRGLRLGVKGGVRFEDLKKGSAGWDVESGRILVSGTVAETTEMKERGILNTELEWVKLGLLSMKELRWIEIQIEDEGVSRDTKLLFCEELADVLNREMVRSDGWRGNVKVVFVERMKVEEKREGEVWYSGGPTGGDVPLALGA